ncbi:ubiquitin-conjugating enzyme [Xylaria sp. CBS 124048]|nr:ubiquitin-conjugating enzyme [Xylaria sp. CBS 124048]
MSVSNKRLAKELQECTSEPPAGMTIGLRSESDLQNWSVTLYGPPGTAYAGGTFKINVAFPSDYPFKPPQVNFATRIYHPNVTNDAHGNICLAILKPESWKPASRIRAILDALRQLLIEPNPDDPLEARIADEYRNNRSEFEENAKSYVIRYAKSA